MPSRSPGSLAVLLHRRQPVAREIVCDTDGLLCNFWRGLRADPEAVAYWAAWPTIHQDLTARHTWLRDWRAEHGGEVERDPDFYDVKVAGWWVWGLSNWIGGGWCGGSAPDKRPMVINQGGGAGVSAQRGAPDKLPKLQPHTGGFGVQAQRTAPPDKRPHVRDKDNHRGVQGGGGMPVSANTSSGGQGVQAQRGGERGVPDAASAHRFSRSRPRVQRWQTRHGTGDILDGSRWASWFARWRSAWSAWSC